MTTARKILDLLTPQERRRGLVVLAMVLLMALIETAGVASVMPFLAVLGNPEVVQTNQQLSWAYHALGFQSTQSFLLVLGIASFGIVVVGSLFRLMTQYALLRWANMRRHSVSQRLLAGYLRQPYEFFLGRNTADLSKSILSEVDELADNVFIPGIQFIAYTFTALVLISFLFIVDPWVALVLGVSLGGAYSLTYIGVRGVLGRLGRDRAEANRERFTAAGEVLGGIKDLKVLGRESAYLERFRGPSVRFSKHRATNNVVAVAPKYLIEAVGFGGVLALALFLMTTREDLAGVLPLLGLYAFAGYRLLPAAQHIFAAFSRLRFGWGAVEEVHKDLMGLRRTHESGTTTAEHAGPPAGSHRRKFDLIELEGVSYRYPGAETTALTDLSLRIPRESTLGVVGTTGAGKTTLVDILLGLLSPSSGAVYVDGQMLTTLAPGAWKNYIGYVPQQIFLTDASLRENIALGVDPGRINDEMVREAARAAQIERFIETLPAGYETKVGERGVRLSGGQIQRVGIARALYHDPEILVLDEATSSLDTGTEALVMEAVEHLKHSKTLVIVAHRMSTVQACDEIVVLEGGRVAARGTFRELMKTSVAFRKVATL